MSASAWLAPITDKVIPQQSLHSRAESVLFYGIVSLLLFGPLAFGAVEPWAVFILEAGTAALFVLWAVQQAISGELRIVGNSLFLPMLAFALLIGLQLASGQTSYRAQTLSSFLLYLAYGMLSFLVVQCLRRTDQIKKLALILSAYGFAVALFALVQGLSSNSKLYWLRAPHFGGWIYGPYVNHNHYAGLMEMLLPIPLVASLSHHVHGSRRGMAALAAAVMAGTIFLSGSRGGMFAFSLQMASLAIVLIRQHKSRRTALVFGAFLLITFGLVTWLGGRELTERMATLHSETRAELSAGTRLNIDRDALKILAHKPVLGWGLGTFVEVYPAYRTFYTNLLVDHAHNDYLELLVETGALGFATMLWFLVNFYRRTIKKLKSWPFDPDAAIALAALLSVSGILAHSLVDFNLQIPANAALFYVLCVVAVMQPRPHLHKHHSRHTAEEFRAGADFRIPATAATD